MRESLSMLFQYEDIHSLKFGRYGPLIAFVKRIEEVAERSHRAAQQRLAANTEGGTGSCNDEKVDGNAKDDDAMDTSEPVVSLEEARPLVQVCIRTCLAIVDLMLVNLKGSVLG